MKLFLPVLAICIIVAFGDQPQEIGFIHIGDANPEPVDTGDLLYAQTYDYDLLINGFHWGKIADDFELSVNASIDEVVVWMAYIYCPTPDYLDLAFSQDIGDEDPNTATPVWSGTASCTHVDIYTFPGCTLYQTTCALPSPPSLTAGTRYWLEVTLYDDDLTAYLAVMLCTCYTQAWLNDGEPPWETTHDRYGYEADMFFELYGMPESALENSTWGNIKSIF